MGTGTTLNAEVTGAGQDTKSFARHLPTVARVLLGLLFFVFGLNGFLNFIPPPSEPIPEGAMALSMAFMKSGYMMPLIKGTEVLVGLLLLTNRFVPLALALLAPVVVNIVAFHAFLAPTGIVMTVVVLALHLYLAWAYRATYRPMLVARAVPGAK
ncbi:DoxX family membrane protein [Myxococcus sp. CA040A]|uniref:DoxX family membrane protein n=1 Tax=Myxococcus sp. CA040A TaxID=2741738 RepID=UPI00157A67FF|nr:DoxX family membrane protein [Myxococcus sp. CA040A]NTX04347.1 DoxX family membrane protein [Myxococcus sp. CA040A]